MLDDKMAVVLGESDVSEDVGLNGFEDVFWAPDSNILPTLSLRNAIS